MKIRRLFPDKATPELVLDAINRSVPNAGRRKAVVLWDGYGDIADYEHINCETEDVSRLADFPVDETIFIYACTQDDLGAPFVRAIHQMRGKYRPIRYAEPCLYTNIDTVARRALETELQRQEALGFAKWDFGPHDFIGLLQALNIAKDVEGAYVEVGCYRGSSAGAVLRYLGDKAWSRRCYFLDVFEGFDYPEAKASADSAWANTHATEGRDAVAERLQYYTERAPGLAVEVHKNNIISDELPESIGQIAVANLDVDLYEAVIAGLRKLAPRIAPGGVLVVEDPGHSPFLIGARLALDEFLDEGGRADFIPVLMNSGQTYLIRR